jgi:hypothetical protein
MEIYGNIETRAGIASTAKKGGKALSMIAAIPTFLELMEGARSLGLGEFQAAQASFAKAAMIPGADKLLNEAVKSVLFDEPVNWENVSIGRDSLIKVVTVGLPDTSNLIAAAIYSCSDTPVPEDSQFRMDPSVLNDLYKYIPEEVDDLYPSLHLLNLHQPPGERL